MALKEPETAGAWLFSRVFRYPRLVFLAAAAAVAGAFAFCAFAAAAGDFFDAAHRGVAAEASSRCALRAAAYAFLCAAAWFGGSLAGGALAARVERDCLADYHEGLLAKDFLFHFRRADFRQRPAAIGAMVSPGLVRMFQAAAACLVFLGMTARLHFFLLPVPVLFTFFVFFRLKSFDWNGETAILEEEERREVLAADWAEAAAGRETLVSQAMEAAAENRFGADALFLRDACMRREKAASGYAPAFFFAIFLGTALTPGFFLQENGMLSAGGLAAFAGSCAVFLYVMRVCPSAYTAVRRGQAAARRMWKIMREKSGAQKSAAKSPAGKLPPGESAAEAGVVFDNVFFSYEKTLVLRRINFSLKPGVFALITGTAGSGKTTLARLIARALEPDIGAVRIGCAGAEEARIAFIEGSPCVFPLSVRENIALGNPAAHDADIREAAQKAEAHEFISGLPQGYDTRAGEGGAEFSADEKLRIALARAFLADPHILVVDDAVGAVDSKTEDSLRRAIRAVAKGRTAFVVSHRLSQIRWADYILFMKNGELLCQGTHEQLVLESADYRRVFSGL
jgi:ATP-binding cassette subfamily B protein